ncbi:MAG: hypothetical protein ACJAS1_003680 [Oleiphilaceae bacterium]|jgi:hypothetical protein
MIRGMIMSIFKCYERRLEDVKSVECAEKEIVILKAYIRRAKAKAAPERICEAEKILRKFRLNIFNIEDFFVKYTPTHANKETGMVLVKTNNALDNSAVYLRCDLQRLSLNDDEVEEIKEMLSA